MQEDRLYEKALKKKEMFQGVLVSVEHWDVALPDGREALREIVRHVGGAAVVPLDEKGNVTLVRQYRVAMGRVMTEIPAGKRDGPDEDPLLCVQRELAEETGLRAANWQYLTKMDTSPGFLTEHIWLYLATGLSQGETHPDEDEFLGLVRMPLEEAVGQVMRGELSDAKTAVGLLMAWQAVQASHAAGI